VALIAPTNYELGEIIRELRGRRERWKKGGDGAFSPLVEQIHYYKLTFHHRHFTTIVIKVSV
jgi:hypothetical protein